MDVTPGNNNSVIVASYLADVTSLAGGAGVVLSSGFLNPANNQNGPAFGLLLVLPDGTANLLPVVTGINEPLNSDEVIIYPNPANEVLTVNLKGNQSSKITIMDLSGREIFSQQTDGTSLVTINIEAFAKGTYLLNTVSDNKVWVKKIVVK